jgi:hypothetical protein
MLSLRVDQAAKEGRMVRGRQLLFLIYQRYKTAEQAGALFNITDLMKVRLNKGPDPMKSLEGFLNAWETTLADMSAMPAETHLEHLFLEQVKHSPVLTAEIAHYHRLDPRGTRSRMGS